MQKPDSNLPVPSLPWGRYMEKQDTEQMLAIASLAGAVDQLGRGDGDIAGTIAYLKTNVEKLLFEMERLYGLSGQTYPPTNSAKPAPPAPPVSTTVEMDADWSRTWGSSTYYTGGGSDTNGTYLYQGSNPENKIGMWHFSLGSALGKNITNVAMYLRNINSPYQSTFTAGFGTHGNGSAPSGKPGRVNPFDVGWSRGEGKWISVPAWAYPGLSNGSVQGFTIGGIGPSDPNYAYFAGVGQAGPPRLRVTYTS